METTETRQINGHNIACANVDAGSKTIVIFCHGFRSSTIGPNRFFVRASRLLAEHSISSVRFDQYGSGNSEGDFVDSSFDDWMETTKVLAEEYLAKGYRVALFGQSMGGATVIGVGASLPKLSAIVSWVPDPNVEDFIPSESGIFEEGGQNVQCDFWQEAHDARIAEKLASVKAPTYIVQCSDDEFVSEENHKAIEDNARPHHTVEMFKGRKHSSWSYDDATDIIQKSVDFIVKAI